MRNRVSLVGSLEHQGLRLGNFDELRGIPEFCLETVKDPIAACYRGFGMPSWIQARRGLGQAGKKGCFGQ